MNHCPCMIESLSFYLLLSVAFLTVMKITLRIKLALNALMHSHVVLKKQFFFWEAKANCTTSWECGQISEQFNKAFNSFSPKKKKKKMAFVWFTLGKCLREWDNYYLQSSSGVATLCIILCTTHHMDELCTKLCHQNFPLCPKQRNWIWLVPPNIFTKKKDTTCDILMISVSLKFHQPIQYISQLISQIFIQYFINDK